MTPFKAIYGRDPSPIILVSSFTSKVEAEIWLAEERDGVLDELRTNLLKEQHRVKQQTNKKLKDLYFQVGDWVYLKAQPYRLRSLAQRRNEKLPPRYYGPFQILDRIGEVAYKLQLPSTSKIYVVFQIKLKKVVPSPPPSSPIAMAIS